MILCDENISYRIVKKLEERYPGITHVTKIGLGTRPGDEAIFLAARRMGYPLLVTNDKDFVTLVDRLGTPPKIILLRTGNIPTNQLADELIDRRDKILRFINDPDREVYQLFLFGHK